MNSNRSKTKTIAMLLAVVLALAAVVRFHSMYPEITWPVINSYSKAPDSPSSNGSPYKLYYEQLSNVEKQAYNMILDKIYTMPDKILVPDLNETELDNVFRALLYDNPDLFFLGRKCSVKAELWNDFFSVDYIMSKDEYYKEKRALDRACREIIGSLTDPDDEYQTELEIHNAIVNRCKYELVENDYVYSSAYGCLVNNVAACEGYSKAAKMLLDEAGIESALISGNASSSKETGGAHMWNIVKIDGDYYHLDCTWDDPVTNEGESLKLYTYFNVTDEAVSKTHSDFSIDVGCTSTAANYYVRNSLTFTDYSRDDEAALAKAISKQHKAGETQIQINFGNEKSYKKAASELITGGRIYNVLDRCSPKLSSKLKGYYPSDDVYTLTIIFKS